MSFHPYDLHLPADCSYCQSPSDGNGPDPDEGFVVVYDCGTVTHPMAGSTRSDLCRKLEAGETIEAK